MGLFQRIGLIFHAKANKAVDRMENPGDALDLAYEKQLQALQRVRRGVADVVTSQKQLEIQQRQMEGNRTKLDDLARKALQQGREDLAASVLTQGELIETQLAGLRSQILALEQQRENLESAGERLQSRVTGMRTQKETLKAQYSAARATVDAGEAVTGVSKEMDEVELMVDRARAKMLTTQARAEAVSELMDSGVLGRLSSGGDAVEGQIKARVVSDNVDVRLSDMKRQLGLDGPSRAE